MNHLPESLKEEEERIVVYRPKPSAHKLHELEEQARLLKIRQKQIEDEIKGELQGAQPQTIKFPTAQKIAEDLLPIRKRVLDTEGQRRRAKVWLNWLAETGEVILTSDLEGPIASAVKASVLIGPRTSVPIAAENLVSSLKAAVKEGLTRYGPQLLKRRLSRRSPNLKLGRLPGECSRAFPSLDEVSALFSSFRKSNLLFSEIEGFEGLNEAQLRKAQAKALAEGIRVYGLYRPDTKQLRLVTSQTLEKFKLHAQSTGYWPFLVGQATWRRYQNCRQVAGFLRRDLCQVYQDYIAVCQANANQQGDGPPYVEIEGIKVPNVVIVVREGQRAEGPRKGRLIFEGKTYKEVEAPDEAPVEHNGVIMPSHLQHIRNLRNKR